MTLHTSDNPCFRCSLATVLTVASRSPFMRHVTHFCILPLALLLVCILIMLPCSASFAGSMEHGGSAVAPSGPLSVGQMLFNKIHQLIGTWDAPLGSDVITDVFQPFALDTAILGEEWLNGKQITSTVL